MASNQTTNFGLNQWEPGDRVLREEFNSDNQKIDGALGTIPKIVAGTYTGDGEEVRTIELGFAPKLVWLCRQDGLTQYNSTYYGGLAMTDQPVIASSSYDRFTVLALTGNGFQVSYAVGTGKYVTSASNSSGAELRYFAVG